MPLKCIYPIVVIIVLAQVSAARATGLDDALGLEAAITAASQAFASPALPSLNNDGQTFSTMLGSVTVQGVATDVPAGAPAGSYAPSYSGTVQGNVASLTYDHSGSGDFGYFATAAWSQVSGDMAVAYNGKTDTVSGISATTYIASAGLSYRLIGDAKSLFALGLFAGPAYMSTTSSETVTQYTGAVSQGSANPNMSGYYTGLQTTFRFGRFFINPYLNVFNDTSEHCRSLDFAKVTGNSTISVLCANGQPGVEIDGAITGYGLNIGWGHLHANVTSQSSSTMAFLKATSFSLAFSF